MIVRCIPGFKRMERLCLQTALKDKPCGHSVQIIDGGHGGGWLGLGRNVSEDAPESHMASTWPSDLRSPREPRRLGNNWQVFQSPHSLSTQNADGTRYTCLNTTYILCCSKIAQEDENDDNAEVTWGASEP